MKKYYTSLEFIEQNTRWANESFRRRLRHKEKLKSKNREKSSEKPSNEKATLRSNIVQVKGGFIKKQPVIAPADFRLIDNPEGCLEFFRDIRSSDFLNEIRYRKFVNLSLKFVTQIDYATISVLTAISDDLKFKGITLQGDFPDEPSCKQFIIDSGFLNQMVDENNRPFPPAKSCAFILFEKGSGVLSNDDNMKISLLVKNVVKYLTGEEKYFLPVKTVILEICGNSIEWGGTQNKQWLLGVKYEAEKVIFTVADVGKGIIETLHKRFALVLKDFVTYKSDSDILYGAFEKKYGSSTKEANRNKGLPAIKENFKQGAINNLKVLTNNVILDFQNESLSKTFDKGSPRFRGTFYQWEMTSGCLNKII